MTIKSAPYYWLECDSEGCAMKTSDLGEYTAYADEGYAEEEAAAHDWITRDDKHYCDKHAEAFRCPNCREEIENFAAGCSDPECIAEAAKTATDESGVPA